MPIDRALGAGRSRNCIALTRPTLIRGRWIEAARRLVMPMRTSEHCPIMFILDKVCVKCDHTQHNVVPDCVLIVQRCGGGQRSWPGVVIGHAIGLPPTSIGDKPAMQSDDVFVLRNCSCRSKARRTYGTGSIGGESRARDRVAAARTAEELTGRYRGRLATAQHLR